MDKWMWWACSKACGDGFEKQVGIRGGDFGEQRHLEWWGWKAQVPPIQARDVSI